MTFALSLALTLGAGLHADAGPAVIRRRFAAAWGKTEVFVAHATPWDLTRLRAWRHTEGWSLRFALRHRLPYGLRLEGTSRVPYADMRLHRLPASWPYGDARRILLRHLARYEDAAQLCARNIVPYADIPQTSARHLVRYGDMPLLRARHRAPYRDVAQVRARHLMPYADLGSCRRTMRFPYWLTRQVSAAHALVYAVTDVNPVARRFAAPWSLLDDTRLQAVANTPELVWNGQTVRIVQATLSCDEDSPVWIAQVEVAELADFAAIAIGDAITLALGLETFVLVVDGKTLSRESEAEQRCELTAASKAALLEAPFAGTMRFYRPEAVSARVAVEALVGPVSWLLPDWIVPAGRLMLEGVTPLSAARNLVGAIGGIVESNPDSSLVCRRRHPVSIPQYGTAAVAHSLFDSDVLSARAQVAPSRGYNRVTIANEDGAAGGSADQLEYMSDASDANRGTVRAYLAANRPVLLAHTGHAATTVESLGEVTRSETETVEFVEGRASVRYPVTAILDAIWRHTDLGAVAADGRNLVAATAGYSLLAVTYTTTSLNWRVALTLDEEVQFVLVDS